MPDVDLGSAVDLAQLFKKKTLLELFGLEEDSAKAIMDYVQRLTKERWRDHIFDRKPAGLVLNVGSLAFCSYMQGLTDGLKARKEELDNLHKALENIADILHSVGCGLTPDEEDENVGKNDRPGATQPDPGEAATPERKGADGPDREGAGNALDVLTNAGGDGEVSTAHCCGGSCHGGENNDPPGSP